MCFEFCTVSLDLDHNVQKGVPNYEKMLEAFWDMGYITIYGDIILLKDF